MIWGILAVNMAAGLYMIFVMKEYKLLLRVAQVNIERLQKRSRKLEKSVEQEEEKTREMRGRLQDIQQREADMKDEVVSLNIRIQQASELENNLEMDMYRAEFKRSRKRTY